MSIVQSVVIDRDVFTLQETLEYLIENNYKFYITEDYDEAILKKIDRYENVMRFRQENSEDLLKKGYNHYHIKYIKEGVELVIASKKENSNLKLYI